MERTAPLYDEAKAAGEIANWGWGRHHTGGKWRRFFFGSGNDAAALMDTLDALADKSSEIEGSESFSEICGQHVDYLWKQVASSTESVVQNPGTVGVSQYLKCDMNDEGFADEIVKGHLSKVFDAHVGEGKLTSWTWAAHQIGGEYRRLLAFRAGSRADMLDVWDKIVQGMSEEHGDALRKFTEICFAHEDYLWMTGSSAVTRWPGKSPAAVVFLPERVPPFSLQAVSSCSLKKGWHLSGRVRRCGSEASTSPGTLPPLAQGNLCLLVQGRVAQFRPELCEINKSRA